MNYVYIVYDTNDTYMRVCSTRAKANKFLMRLLEAKDGKELKKYLELVKHRYLVIRTRVY